MDKQQIEQMYPSKIEFYLDIDGETRLPRSTNIEQMRWSGSANEFNLFVEFRGSVLKSGIERPSTGYVYKTNVDTWYKLLAGVEALDLSDDPLRRSTGRVFHQEIRGKVEYKKVF